jgi:hypothetical protein
VKHRRFFATLLGAGALSLAACGSSASTTQSAGGRETGSTTSTSHDMANMSDHDMAGISAADMAKHDDRGFSALENGMQHGATFQQPISNPDRAELSRQLTLAREVALQYPTVADAEAAGLHRAGPFSPGLGAHYISYANALGNADGVMSDDDIRKPLAWIYDGTHQDSRVAGLFYMTGKANAQGFAGPNDTWHVHHDICIKTTAGGVIDAPLGADHDATREQCDAVGGNLLRQTGYLLHTWVVPGYESPEGVFTHLSSTMSCDDGSYHVIDVTKVGTRTTLCVDGTE